MQLSVCLSESSHLIVMNFGIDLDFIMTPFREFSITGNTLFCVFYEYNV